MRRPTSIVLALALWGACLPGTARAEEPQPETRRDVVYATLGERELKLDLYLPPKGEAQPPLIVWVHGGGWRRGTKQNCRLRWIVPDGYAVASVEYRLTDEAVFPAQIHDVKGAVRFLRANAAKYGFDATRIGIGGSSAGGHLAALMGTSGGVQALEGTVGGNLETSSRVQAVYDLFGPAELLTMGRRPDGTPRPLTSRGAVGKLVGGDADMAKQASPTTYVTADDPPFLIAHGDSDRLVPLAQSETLRELLDASEVPARLMVRKGAGHGGPAFESADLRAAARAFLAKHLKGEAVSTPPIERPVIESPVIESPATGDPALRSALIDSLSERGRYTVKQQSVRLTDEKRGKALAVRVSYPAEKGAFPVLVWSHGMGGSKDAYGPLVEHWVSRGYVVVQATHSDSRRLPRDARARGFADWANRPLDVAFLLDALDDIAAKLEGFAGTLDKTQIGMGGHSYGAHTTMLVGGATTPDGKGGRATHADIRPKAFFVLSGQGLGERFDAQTWEGVARPMFVMTGTRDTGRNGQPFTWRTDPYTYAPAGDKYLAILEGAFHSFGGISGAPARPGRPANDDHVRTVKALSLVFFDAYVRGDGAAKALLASDRIAKQSAGTLRVARK